MSDNNLTEATSSESDIESELNEISDPIHSSDDENNPGSEDEDDLEEEDDEEKGESNDDCEDDSEKPDEIKAKTQIFDCDFHPNRDILSIGEISGRISLFSFSSKEKNKKLLQFKHHKSGCRSLSFSLDGTRLYSVSKDKSLCCTDMNTGAIIKQLHKAHDNSISSLIVASDNLIATGCDKGTVKVWDTRTFDAVSEYSNRKDYISDMVCSNDSKHLLCTSGDGVLSVYNLRKKKLEKESDQLDEELLCIDVIKNGQKVICGSAVGVLNVFSWGEWSDISDRFPTKFESIDTLCAVTDEIVCIGSDSGVIKAMFVHPYKEVRKIGVHGDLGICSLQLSPDKQLMASCGNENTVRFWNVSSLHEELLEQEERKGVKRKHAESKDNDATDFFADL